MVRTVIIKSLQTINKCWRECGEKGALLHYWWECKLVQLLIAVWRLLKNLSIDLPYEPESHSGAYIWKENIILKDTCTPIVNSQDVETT